MEVDLGEVGIKKKTGETMKYCRNASLHSVYLLYDLISPLFLNSDVGVCPGFYGKKQHQGDEGKTRTCNHHNRYPFVISYSSLLKPWP